MLRAMDNPPSPALWSEPIGAGAPALLLLHGLGATGEVWRGFADAATARWPGRILLVDLPGHGRSGRLAAYTYEAYADAVQGLLGGGPAVVVGHSMGGAVGLVLAGRPAAGVAAAIGIGIKARWTEEDVAGMRRLAARPARHFDTREEAATRYLRSVGLDQLVTVDDPMVDSGIVAADGGGTSGDVESDAAGGEGGGERGGATAAGHWRLALDQAAFAIDPPDLAGYLDAARCPVTLARGSGDHMVSQADLAALHPAPRELPGLGHNAHVENPAAVWRLVEAALSAAGTLPIP
jgi:pimeloyl-ACP methyl ester carboxylesterase